MDARTLCLGVLMLGDSSGYEIKKHFEEGPFAHFHAAGFGSIYPALNALLADGMVTCTELAQDRRPDKKIYAITEVGRRAFRRALHKKPAPDAFRSEATFMLFFAELLDREHVIEVYDAYLESLRECVRRMAADDAEAPCTPGRRLVRGYGLAVYAAAVDYLEANRRLVLAADGGARDAAE